MKYPVFVLSMVRSGGRVPCWILRDLKFHADPDTLDSTQESRPFMAWAARNMTGFKYGFRHTGDEPFNFNPDPPWFLKESRLMWCVPMLLKNWPNGRFIHVVRDGRDWAFNLRRHRIERPKSFSGPNDVVEYARQWAFANRHAREQIKNSPHLTLRLEDVAAHPHEWGAAIAEFVGTDPYPHPFTWNIRTPVTVGCRLNQPEDEQAAVEAACIRELGVYGYI